MKKIISILTFMVFVTVSISFCGDVYKEGDEAIKEWNQITRNPSMYYNSMITWKFMVTAVFDSYFIGNLDRYGHSVIVIVTQPCKKGVRATDFVAVAGTVEGISRDGSVVIDPTAIWNKAYLDTNKWEKYD